VVFALIPTTIGLVWAGPRQGRLPDRFLPTSQDEPPVLAEGPAGTMWSAWGWFERGEYDIAVAFRSAEGVWDEPRFLGRGDGFDQRDAALAVDQAGTVYVAFTLEPLDEVRFAVLPSWSDSWIGPVTVSESGSASGSPALRIVGGRLILAFRTGDDVRILDIPLLAEPRLGTNGIQEGPDVVDPLGRSSDRDEDAENRDRNRWGHGGETPNGNAVIELRPGLGEQRERR